MAMTLVSTVTVGSGGAASIEFTNIPQTGKDLLIVSSLRTDGGSQTGMFLVRFNSDTLNYSNRRLYGDGSTVATDSSTSYALGGAFNATGSTSNTFSNSATYVSNYATSQSKSVSTDGVSEHNAATTVFSVISAANWNSSSAITSALLTSFSGNLVQNSTASLYIIS